MDLRGEIEVWVRRRLANAVFDARARIARAADDAEKRAAVLLAPNQAIGGERVGPVALVAVDGRRTERAGASGVIEQARQIVLSDLREVVPLGHEGVSPILGQ